MSKWLPGPYESLFIGPGLMIMGGAMTLYIYAWSSIVNPALHGWSWWRVVLAKMLSNGGWLFLGIFLLGFFVLGSGIFRLARGAK